MGFSRYMFLAYCISCCFPKSASGARMRLIREWSSMDYAFPSQQAAHEVMGTNQYTPGSAIPIDVDVQHRANESSRIFLTTPRFDFGRPVTLGTVDSKGRIQGYPSYEWNANQGSNCDGLTSVFRVAIDRCDRLWVMDTGKIGETQYCKPQLLAFDLRTDQLVFRHRPDDGSYVADSLFITPVVDIRGKSRDCRGTFVYVADVTGFGILVVDVDKNESWRIAHKHFYPYPSAGTFTINGESFDLMDGVFGMALSQVYSNGDRILYFHALASVTENVVWTSVLRNSSNAGDIAGNIGAFPEHRKSQAAIEALDANGIMYFGQMDPPAILCWNTATEYSPRNIHALEINPETLQFASGLKIVNNLKGEQELWVITCRFQKVMTGTMTQNETNFRVLAEKVSTLLLDSPCKNGARAESSYYIQPNQIFLGEIKRQGIGYRFGINSL